MDPIIEWAACPDLFSEAATRRISPTPGLKVRRAGFHVVVDPLREQEGSSQVTGSFNK